MKTSTNSVYENVVEDVINNVRDEFNSDGPGQDVLNELRGVWETKMMQAGVVNGSIHRFLQADLKPGGPITAVHDLNVPYDSTEEYKTPKAEILFPPAYVDGRDRVDSGTSQQSRTQNLLMLSSGKRKREDSATQYHPNRFIPQQDGAGDVSLCIFEIEASETGSSHGRCGILTSKIRTKSLFKPKSSIRITQNDGLMPDPYEDVLSTPNIYNYHGGFNEDYNIANTPAPNDLLNTPALPSENGIAVDDDEPPLNENDDDDFEDVSSGEDQNM